MCLFWVLFALMIIIPSNTRASDAKILYDAMIDVRVFDSYSVLELEQDEMMYFAYNNGKKYNLGETLRAIVFLESGFGKTGRIGDNGIARGVTQIQIPTAKFILAKIMNIDFKFTDNQIKKLLTYNDKLSIILSKYYLVYLMDKFKNHESNWSKGLLSYNVGPSGVRKKGLNFDPNGYLKKAKKFIKRQRS